MQTLLRRTGTLTALAALVLMMSLGLHGEPAPAEPSAVQRLPAESPPLDRSPVKSPGAGQAGPLSSALPTPVTDEAWPRFSPEVIELGQKLYFDPIISGNRNIACATCHHPALATSDGVSLSVGEGAVGLGPERHMKTHENVPEQRLARHSPTLFNLGAAEFTVLFHDGRLESAPRQPDGMRTPLGEDMVAGFNGVLSAQAMFPVLSGDEMAGHYSENEVSRAVRKGLVAAEGGAWETIAARVSAIDDYASRFAESYTHLQNRQDIHFTDIANAIAAFMAVEFRADDSPFDRYLRGQSDLPDEAMNGMALFYGKAGCATCHAGPFQTDHGFHAIAMPQFGPGKAARFETHQRDEGRARVTGHVEDRFRFRTPSLRNVALSAPYGHTGAYATLEAVVEHHLDPVGRLQRYDRTQAILAPSSLTEEGSAPWKNDWAVLDDPLELESIATANELQPRHLSTTEITALVAFLHALTDPISQSGRLGVPNTVPSGLPVEQVDASRIATPRFIDQTTEQAFEHRYTGGWEHFVGGGVAVFDCNTDGFPDALAAGGESPASLLINRTGKPGADLAFELSTDPVWALEGVTGAYPLDIDNDATLDLVVLRVGANRVLRGLGDCRFEPADEMWGFDGGDHWTTAFSATWEPGHNMPTLAIGNYVDRKNPDGPFEACDHNELHRTAQARYDDITRLAPGYCALSMLISDWGRRGQADLFVSNDRHYYVRGGAEQLWALSPRPQLYTEAEGWGQLSIWGMGIASRDLDRDGLPEMFLTSMGDQRLRLLDTLANGPTYKDAPFTQGSTAHIPYTGDDGRPSSGWHAAFGDMNNDGLDDLFIAKGNVEQMPDSAMIDPNNLLIQQADGTFIEHGLEAGVANAERSRGAAVIDLNRDGRLDILVNSRRAPLQVLQNDTLATGHWLTVAATQPETNRHAVGAWLEVRSAHEPHGAHWHREITVGGGHAGGVAGPEHFGLGTLRDLQVRVTWPDGQVSRWMSVAANQTVQLVRQPDGSTHLETALH